MIHLIRQMAEDVIAVTGSSSVVEIVPARRGDLYKEAFDTSMIKQLGWEAKVSWKEGLQKLFKSICE